MPGLTVAALYVLPDGPYAASTRMRPLAPDYTRPTADEVDQKRIEPADELRRKRVLFDEALEEHARPDVGWLHAPRPRPNTTHEVLPRGDRDEDEES